MKKNKGVRECREEGVLYFEIGLGKIIEEGLFE